MLGYVEWVVRLSVRITWYVAAVLPGHALMAVHGLVCHALNRPMRPLPVIAYRLGGLMLFSLAFYAVTLTSGTAAPE